MEFVSSLPLVAWLGLAFLALAFLVAGAFYMFLNGLSHYNKAAELDGLNHNIKAAEERYKQLTAELNGLNDELANARQTISDGKAAQAWLEAHDATLTAKKAEFARLDGDIKAYGERKDKLAKEADELQTQINQQAEDLQKARLEQLQADNLKKFAEQVRQKAEEDLKALKKEIAEATATRDALQKEVAALRPLEERVKALKGDVAQAEAQRDALRKAIDEKRGIVSELEGRAAGAKGILSQLSFMRKEQEEIWADLETAVIRPPNSPRTEENRAEVEWLKVFTQQLDNAGFRFNPRLVNAFHTGLKCGDMTPLVVLAGISGTGKSLLPELYAAVAGMNFLAVPIQPRWDSPQDLFGFFNYMEGRYKATELARFLWQVDRFNNKEHALRDDSLSVVLLDEMNLARVEYYFSDLLSKLEMRRGLDPKDSLERAKAEIVIEGNAGSKGGAKRLFVGSDVFFIGTMNEDETTQMLSDKVVDRANIMRFGKPAKMAQAPDKLAILKTFGTQPRLTRTLWERWKAEERQKNVSRFEDVAREPLDKLNVAFERIGRPFGHRVWQAVKSYITHYPVMSIGNERYDERTAFADQLEMKILPKLNGIELSAPNVQHVMADISGVLAKLGDDKLAEAFDAAKDTNVNTFFKWRGVMR